ncbi:MAG TPA: MarR family winged helix-turn-helix transcriptional regulator [Labilithrix sp.]|nr:MarR family winged helix-turn-helix transcriptional regulator [Labilithrix sp.]
MGSDDYADKLEAAKARSTVQLLFKAARLLNERAIGQVRQRMNKPVRVAHTTLLPHVDLAGTRLTDLASRLGVTKQAAGQLVDELVEMGVLERVPDPADARAKLVRFSARGRAGLLEGLGVLREIEAGIASLLGDKKMRALHEALTAIVAAEVTEDASAEEARPPRRR